MVVSTEDGKGNVALGPVASKYNDATHLIKLG